LEGLGYNEAVLTGLNICQYRDLQSCDFQSRGLFELIDYLLKGTEKIRLRLSSIEPEPNLDLKFENDNSAGAFFEVLANKRIRPHFHLAIQSGSAKVLKEMGRPYTPVEIELIVNFLRRQKSDPFLACDIIAGFPGETESEFEETLRLCEKLDFAWIHAFPFSSRPGTPAFNFRGNVEEREKKRRAELFFEIARKGRLEYIRRWVGKEVEAVVEEGFKDAHVPAVSENYLKLFVDCTKGPLPAPRSLIRCRILKPAKGKFDAFAILINPDLPLNL
jgi:threonylcarbamoyladenosine tRNA methylthiotransferase MtaB